MSLPIASTMPTPLDGGQTERLENALSGLTPAQLQWISGYAAGMAAANSPAPAIVADPANSLTILYGSQTGNGEGIALDLESRARQRGFAVRLSNLADYKPANLKREKLVTFVVSTHGEGDPPDDAELFREFLLSNKAPGLEGLQYSVLALGDSSYINFCETGREFDARLAELGAARLVPLAECDLDYETAAAAWCDEVVARIPDIIDAGEAIVHLRAVEAAPQYDKQRPFPAEVLVHQKITGAGSSKDVRHIELSLEGSGQTYEPGDALAVLVENPPALVAELVQALRLDADTEVKTQGETLRLHDALHRKLEITLASLGFLRSWAGFSAVKDLQKLLQDGDQSPLSSFMDTHQIIDVVRRYPARVEAQQFVDILRKLNPRSYSIASSALANPDEVHLTVAAVRYEAFGSPHWGAASTYLADRIEEGQTVAVFIEPNSRFRLPADDNADIIMIGPGTGVAPFRAFLEQRDAREAGGRNWLFFGDRNFSSDFLYQLEWQRYLKQGRLDRLDVAFSRDQSAKVYVQDRILENAADIHAWIEGGAYLYVCGDAKRMAGDVDQALIDVFARNDGSSPEQAEARVKELRRSGRYQRDVY